METTQSKKCRETGIDALRILSMGMVLLLHILGVGGVIRNTAVFSAQNRMAWLLEVLSYCAVNCYAMITGYVMIGKQRRWSRLLELWLEVVLYSVGTTVVRRVLFHENVADTELLCSFFPVFRRQYWYFSAYAGMMLLLPYYNRMLESLSRKEHRNLLLGILILFCLMPKFWQVDTFRLQDGYSMVWLMMLYAVGAYARRYIEPERWPVGKCLACYLALSGILWINQTLGALGFRVLSLPGEADPTSFWLCYDSPLVVLQAAALFQAFRGMKFENQIVKKGITFLAPLSFGVYLIHLPLFFGESWDGKFAVLAEHSAGGMVVRVLGIAAAGCGLCIGIDFIRSLLFRRLRISQWTLRIEQALSRQTEP